MITFLQIVTFLAFVGALAAAYLLPKLRKVSIAIATVLFIFGIALVTGTAIIPPTSAAVVENTWTGEFFILRGGTHIFLFNENRLIPLVTRVTKYDLRQQMIQVGQEPAAAGGVPADSSSPGRPVVFFVGRGWAAPNLDLLIDLHRQRGPDYLDDWVEEIWPTVLKRIQGDKPYDFVGNNRLEFQNIVEEALQRELVDVLTGEPLVVVSQIAVKDFDWTEEINNFQDEVAQKQFEEQRMAQQVRIARQAQQETIIKAQTSYSETVRLAEADRKKVELEADARAYSIMAERQATADGIQLVQSALAQAPEYLVYQKQQIWQGEVPQTLILGLDGIVPFMDVLP